MHVPYERQQRDTFWHNKLKDFSGMLTKQRCKCASEGQTVRRMPESNLSRTRTQCCHLLSVHRERGRHSQRAPSQRTLRRGALAMIVRDWRKPLCMHPELQPCCLVTKIFTIRSWEFLLSCQHSSQNTGAHPSTWWPTTVRLQHIHPALRPSYPGGYSQGSHALRFGYK